MPTLHFLRQIPPIAWIPLFLIWFGIGEGSKSAVIFYAAFFPVLLNSLLGIEQIPRRFWEVGKVLEFDYLKFLWRLVLPASLPSIMAGLRLGMSMSWRALVAAEMIAATSGLGYLIMSARSLVRMDEMVVGILLIGLIGILIDAFFIWLERFLAPWNKETLGVGEMREALLQAVNITKILRVKLGRSFAFDRFGNKPRRVRGNSWSKRMWQNHASANFRWLNQTNHRKVYFLGGGNQ